MFNAMFFILAQAAQAAETAMTPDAPVTVNSIVIILTAAGVFLGILGTFLGQMVNLYLTLRNGLKSDLNSAKADAHAVRQDAMIAKVDGVSKQLNGELDAKLKNLSEASYNAGAQSVVAAAIPIAVEVVKQAAVSPETQKPTP